MSPEIRRNGELIADVLDEPGDTRLYPTLDGKNQLLINLKGINPDNKEQIAEIHRLGPSGEWIGEPVRRIGLTQEGKGSTAKIKKGGDGEEPVYAASLHEPIRLPYTEQVWRADNIRSYGDQNGGSHRNVIKTRPNPFWQRK